MKVLVADGRGRQGAGAITVQGAEVGDRIVGVLAQLKSGQLEYIDDGIAQTWFESVVSVDGQVQQLLRLYTSIDNSGASPRFIGPDGNATTFPTTGTRRQLSDGMGDCRFAFLIERNRAASADGAISVTEGTVLITKASAAALTLADPATTDNGRELLIVSITSAAHTVSNAAGSGFNAGGAASDVATFGGAKGDGMKLIAYGGKWYVQWLRNVTLG